MRRIAWDRILLSVGIALLVGVAIYAIVALPLGSSGGDADLDENTYAFIGPERVTMDELERAYSQREQAQENLSIDEYFDESYAPRTMMLLEAERQGVNVSDAEVDGWIATINQTLQSRNASFQTYLDDLNVTLEQLREDIRTTTLLNKMLERTVASQVNVSAEEIEAAYEGSEYEELGIPVEQARYEIGPRILREKQDARLEAVIDELRGRYEIRR